MPTSVTTFPVEYLDAIDEVLVGATYASRYGVGGAEFVSGRQVSVPDIDFGESPDPVDYDRFKTESDVTVGRTVYELDNDKQKVFYTDAVDAIDEAAANATQIVSEYQRTILQPSVDKDFFKVANAKAGGKGTAQLTKDNIKSEIRKARTQFVQADLTGGDLFMNSASLALLEDATNREWSNETAITDTVGTTTASPCSRCPTSCCRLTSSPSAAAPAPSATSSSARRPTCSRPASTPAATAGSTSCAGCTAPSCARTRSPASTPASTRRPSEAEGTDIPALQGVGRLGFRDRLLRAGERRQDARGLAHRLQPRHRRRNVRRRNLRGC